MKKMFCFLLMMTVGLFGCGISAKAPRGKLTYCSYSKTGTAGLGKEYCELIADPGEQPRVNVALNIGNRFHEPEIRKEFPVEPAVVDSLQTMLAQAEVYKLDGYDLDEAITGGHAYRIYQEYDSGEKINARWYGHKVKDQALAAYWMIERFFAPWREQAEESGTNAE